MATESIRDTKIDEGDDLPLREVEPLGLSVRQIRELLTSLDRPHPALLVKLSRDPRITVRRMAYRRIGAGGDLAMNEEIFRDGSVEYLAGADEAGRGALAGPLVAAAVMFHPGTIIDGVGDSKEILPARREELYRVILSKAVCVSVSFVDPGFIDRWGLQLANYKALGDAISGISSRCECVICDYYSLTGLGVPSYGFPRADSTFQSVAAASIVAKVERDRVMASLHRFFPSYNFENNKGYGTEEHREVLSLRGPSRVHRLSFKGVGPEPGPESFW